MQPYSHGNWKRQKKLYCIGSKIELGSHTTKMEETRQQVKEILAAYVPYAQVEPLQD
jgi:hypothetical protein